MEQWKDSIGYESDKEDAYNTMLKKIVTPLKIPRGFSKDIICLGNIRSGQKTTPHIGLCNLCASDTPQKILFCLFTLEDDIPRMEPNIVNIIHGYAGGFLSHYPKLCYVVTCITPRNKRSYMCDEHYLGNPPEQEKCEKQ